MTTLDKLIGSDRELKEIFELAQASKNVGIKYDYLIKMAKMVVEQKKQISCSLLYQLRELMVQYMPDDYLTKQIKLLFYYGHAAV